MRSVIVLLLLIITVAAKADQVNESVEMLMQDNEVPGVMVQLYVSGKPQSYYIGHADKAKKVPMTAKTLFLLDPLKDLLASILLAQQIDTASMQLDHGVTDYVPTAPLPYAAMTLQELATYSDDDTWHYSNAGFKLLIAALEKNTHKTIEQLYRDRIKTPLQMTTRKAATSTDLQRLLAASIGLPGTPERIFYQMRMTQSAYVRLADRKQGLGWQIHSLRTENIPSLLEAKDALKLGPLPIIEEYDRPKFNGDSLIDIVGMGDGYTAYMAVIPNRQSGIVIITNHSVPTNELVSEGREILFDAMHISKDEM